MPVTAIEIENFSDRKLKIADSEGCLELLGEIQRLSSTFSSGKYLQTGFICEDPKNCEEIIKQLRKRDDEAYNMLEGSIPLTTKEIAYLKRTRESLAEIKEVHTKMGTACAPIILQQIWRLRWIRLRIMIRFSYVIECAA